MQVDAWKTLQDHRSPFYVTYFSSVISSPATQRWGGELRCNRYFDNKNNKTKQKQFKTRTLQLDSKHWRVDEVIITVKYTTLAACRPPGEPLFFAALFFVAS